MASSNSNLKRRIAFLRHEIKTYKPGKAVPCNDGRVVFPDKLVIGMIDLYLSIPGIKYDIVPTVRRALYGKEESDKLAKRHQPDSADQEEYVTDSIYAINRKDYGLYEGVAEDLAEQVVFMVLLVQSSTGNYYQRWIQDIKESTGRFPVCAILSTMGCAAIEEVTIELKRSWITEIYEVPFSEKYMADNETLQWLELLHECLQEGDRALANNEMKKICMIPGCGLLLEKTKKEATEANQKMFKQLEGQQQKNKSLQNEIRQLKASHESLVNDNAILKREIARENAVTDT